MSDAVIEIPRPDSSPLDAVVTARDVVRRYGEGDTAVDALRGVSVDIAAGRLTAVMGPSGSGKSTLMHILAGLDTPTSGEVSVAGVDVVGLDDTELTKLRRDHIGFIFQFFNLLPMLTAAENIVLPLKLAGGKPDPAWLAELIDTVGLDRPPQPPPLRALRRPAAARRRRPRARLTPQRDVRRRADRQPRLHHQRRDPRAAAATASTRSARPPSWSPTTRTPRRSPTACCSSPTATSSATSAPPRAHEILATLEEVSGR